MPQRRDRGERAVALHEPLSTAGSATGSRFSAPVGGRLLAPHDANRADWPRAPRRYTLAMCGRANRPATGGRGEASEWKKRVVTLGQGAGEGMRRRVFIAVLGGTAACPLAGRAQQPERIRRVGVLLPFPE